MSSEVFKRNLVKRYFNNQCSQHEIEVFFRLMEAGELDHILEDFIDDDAEAQLKSSKTINPDLSREMLDNVWEETNQNKVPGWNHIFPEMINRTSFKVAASLAFFVIALGSILFFNNSENIITHRTQYGETASFTLPDSSKVILNGNSEITYKKNWNDGGERIVDLKGEAFFNVTTKPDRKNFIVHTANGLNVEVLGTRFNVNFRRGKTRVVLNEGSIKLNLIGSQNEDNKGQNSGDPVIMEPGELAEYAGGKENISKKIVNPSVYTSWRNNKLVFEDTSLRNIFLTLKDNYGYTIEVQEEMLLQEKFTATYPADNINILLKALAKSFNLKIKHESDKKLVISKKSP